MVLVSLPDGSIREYASSVSLMEVAQSIGASLAKAALAGSVEGNLVDLSYRLTDRETPYSVQIITPKNPEGVEILRHSTAHLLAMAVKELFPEAQVTIGPVIENGFYYDFSYTRPFTPEDLVQIETRMRAIAMQDTPVAREEWNRDDAVIFFKNQGEKYKAEIIASIPAGQTISLYRQGDFVDLCRGPHVPNLNRLKVFKLTKVAGAYWRGDSNNEMLQRIYGLAFSTQADLDQYLHQLEEAEKRDHRKLGKELDLFHFQEEAPGLAFWHPKGWAIWQVVEQYMRQIYLQCGYQEVRAPQVLDRSLWEKTGHWDNYRDNMFTTESENRYYALKPMNCPGHVQIYLSDLRSYRDLPLRYGEFGQCHRNEPSGALHGLMRVRGFVQDDGHIFCTEDQIQAECIAFTKQLQAVYKDFGFTDLIYKVATRPEKRIGSDEIWDKAEKALKDSLKESGCDYIVSEGDGAFYGPKIEYTLKDAIGRMWQCGTVQVDFSMPSRLGAEYVAEDNSRKTPVMLHRAILGSMERFIGLLIEHHAGALPLWLAPTQVIVCSISDQQKEYVQTVVNQLQTYGFRAIQDLRNEKINYKIREAALAKIPYILVCGDKEKDSQTLSVRQRGGIDLGTLSLPDVVEKLKQQLTQKN
jgi:threonyl-tRNA synthetase